MFNLSIEKLPKKMPAYKSFIFVYLSTSHNNAQYLFRSVQPSAHPLSPLVHHHHPSYPADKEIRYDT